MKSWENFHAFVDSEKKGVPKKYSVGVSHNVICFVYQIIARGLSIAKH